MTKEKISGYFNEFFETLAALSKKKEVRLVVLGILIGLCLFSCPGRLILFALAGLGAAALYVLYRNLKKEKNHEG